MNQLLAGIEIIKSLGNGAEKRSVLNRVSIEIGEGEFVSVMGPSGSGKSTLLYTLSGMEPIDSGKVIFENQKLSELSDDELSDLRRNRMGFVFQQPTLLKNLSILDNILLPQMRDNRRNIKKLTEKAEMLMKQMGIGELKDREITQASGGQLQRAGICRALLGGPGIIFGDEPTGALNTKAAREIGNAALQSAVSIRTSQTAERPQRPLSRIVQRKQSGASSAPIWPIRACCPALT